MILLKTNERESEEVNPAAVGGGQAGGGAGGPPPPIIATPGETKGFQHVYCSSWRTCVCCRCWSAEFSGELVAVEVINLFITDGAAVVARRHGEQDPKMAAPTIVLIVTSFGP